MVTQIIIHLMPHEIDWLEWQLKQLKQGSSYLEKEDKVIVDITLNLNLTDWDNSLLPKSFFIHKFNQLLKYLDWCDNIIDINEDGSCLGIDDKRRNSIRTTISDNIVYLDCDIIFKPETLFLLINRQKVPKINPFLFSIVLIEFIK